MQTIYNDVLTVSINPKGAELSSIFHKQYNLEYMWDADPAFWAKKSPVLFPIVGTLKNNEFFFQDIPYKLGRHGFARECTFSGSEQSQDAVTFFLRSDEKTFQQYPFNFELAIRYRLNGPTLAVTYTVTNQGDEAMYFSVGGHPAFRVPLAEGTGYNQYYLEFSEPETASRWPISPDGLIESAPTPLLQHTVRLPLKKDLFYEDAVVFKHLESGKIALRSDHTPRGLEMDFSGFPYLGIWAARDADFVCLEPWCGIADSVDTTQQLVAKEGINRLEGKASFNRTWTLTLF